MLRGLSKGKTGQRCAREMRNFAGICWGIEMMINVAVECKYALGQSARRFVSRDDDCSPLSVSEGHSGSFVTVDPFMEVRSPTSPNVTHGFASGPASMGGSNGKYKGQRGSVQRTSFYQFFRVLSGVIAIFAVASSTVEAEDKRGQATTHSIVDGSSAASLAGVASVRIATFSEGRSRIRFSASGLPAGLSIHPQTGVISGVIDREATRNGGSPFVVKVAVSNGTAASGVSTIGIVVENRPPIVADDVLRLSSNSAQLNVLANDTDPDGDRLIITDMAASHGAVVFTPTGLVAYAPNPGKSRTDTITYQVDDGHGGLAHGKIQIVVD